MELLLHGASVVHHGTCCLLDLVFQSVIFGKLFVFRRFIYQMREISADLPCFDILESFDFHFRSWFGVLGWGGRES